MKTVSHTALVFRKRMLPYSETFIAAQGNGLLTWKSVFVGATEDQSGLHLLRGAQTCLLTQHVSRWLHPLVTRLFKRFGIIPRQWLMALQFHLPSLIHVHFGPDALFLGIPLSKALGLPLVVTFHGFDVMIDAPNSRYQKNRRKLFDHATKVIAVSDFIAAELVRQGCPLEKITRHYIGIDLDLFRPLEENFVRKDIVFVGRLTEKKGCEYLIHAMFLLANRGCRPRLHIIGDGGLRQKLEKQARPLGGQIVFHGRQEPEAVREMVGRAAVFCVPSVTGRNGDTEGLPMVNLEAMALRTPVVSTFHAGIPEAVCHEQTGLLVPEADPQALALALERCLNDKELAESFGANGMDRVQKYFDIRKQCQDLEAIYESVIATGTLNRR